MTTGVARAGFDLDLLHGEAKEGALAYALTKARVEVKADAKCRETGNLAVEYETRYRDGSKKPSGISVTEAEWWAFEIEDDTWLLLETVRLKDFARRAIEAGRHKWAGDDNRFHLALVPLAWTVPAKPVAAVAQNPVAEHGSWDDAFTEPLENLWKRA